MVLIVLSLFQLSVPGYFWPWYSVMAVFAVVPIIVGPNRYRVFGALALAFSIFLILGDIELGKHFRAKIQHIRDGLHSTNAP
jgi:hypothetical protein